jgi:hypothetical protein
MPEGLYAGLSLQEFADLVSFLESLKGNSKKVEEGFHEARDKEGRSGFLRGCEALE